ncbi:class I SAM-dependent methyltransferase [Ponticoccus sp. SC6-36]|nr:class I SAM-dependent methyltransferase [Ponticoccus sp. SC6-36]
MQAAPGMDKTPRGPVPEEGWPAPAGAHYLDCLERLQTLVAPDWYLEIGTDRGASLALATCRSIAIDPDFKIAGPVWDNKPALHLFRQTSDDVFASGEIASLGAKINLAFIDGMHLFEFVLRDFINVERIMSRDGVIILHDVVPIGVASSAREWDKSKTRAWTGDVWKMTEILRDRRPDLTVDILDARPTGLAIVRGLDPTSDRLASDYDAIVDAYLTTELDPARREDLKETLDMQPAERFLDLWGGVA